MEDNQGNTSQLRRRPNFRALSKAIWTFIHQVEPRLSSYFQSGFDTRRILLNLAFAKFDDWESTLSEGSKLEITTELSEELAYAVGRLLIRFGSMLADGWHLEP